MSLEDEFKEFERQGFIKQIADKLFQGIQSANDKGEPRRWIWELVQNAKDTPNKQGPVKIKVTTTVDELIFEHNGDPFTIKSLTGLLQQVSSKSSTLTEERTTGKFGTGFITTHMLSKIVDVSGIFVYSSGQKKFQLTLDRDANTPDELIEKVKQLMLKKDELASDVLYPPLPDDYIQPAFETRFSYRLSNPPTKYAKQGVDDLNLVGPYTLLFNKSIDSYSIQSAVNLAITITRQYPKQEDKEGEIALFHTCTHNSDGKLLAEQTIAYIKKGEVTIAIPVIAENEKIKEILPLPPHLPTLFKDFPLIGTEGWLFPAVCNCITFEPTEPRDGLFLHQEAEQQESWQVKNNREFLGQVVDLLGDFLELLAAQDSLPENLFLLCRSGLPRKEIQIDVIEFLQTLQTKYRSRIKQIDLVLTADGYKPMSECRFPFLHEKVEPEVAKDFYQLCQLPFGKSIPVEDHYQQWLPIISEEPEEWGEKLPLSLPELLNYISESKEIGALGFADETVVMGWLNKVYKFLIANGHSDYFRSLELLPNQRGFFISLKDAHLDNENQIPDVLKNSGEAFGKKYWETLLPPEIKCAAVTQELTIERISSEINNDIGRLMTSPDRIIPSYLIATARICNVSVGSSADERRLGLVRHLGVIIPEWKAPPEDQPSMKSEYNFDPPLKATTRYCLYKISNCRTITTFCEDYAFASTEKAIEWLNKLAVLLNHSITEIKPLALEFAIFPNQKNELCLAKELAEDIDGIDDFLKNIHQDLFPKVSLRSGLLLNGFDNNFVNRSYTFQEIASDIDRKLLEYYNAKAPDQEFSLKMIDWLSEEKNQKYETFFLSLRQNKANIVLESLPEKKEPIFRLLRLKPDFDKLTTIAESQHLDLLSELAASGVDVGQLNQLLHLATQLGGVEQLESIVQDQLEHQADIKFRLELGTHVELLFKEVFSEFGEAFKVDREGFAHGQDFALIFPNGLQYRIEIKSFARGKERVHMSVRQGETAKDHPDTYALCVLERPNPLVLATIEYFKQNARFITDIGVQLKPKVEAAVDITSIIKKQDTEENAIDFNSTAYRFRIGKKTWEKDTVLNFEKLIEKIHSQ
jgi:hypothetical protein